MNAGIRYLIVAIGLCTVGISARAQRAEDAIREGNKRYHDSDAAGAEQAYKNALELDPTDERAGYNLGNALYRQERLEEAQQRYEEIARTVTDPTEQARAYHNLGNSYLQQKKPKEAVQAYKEALRRTPDDEDTRYNLASALRQLKEQEKQEQQQDDKEKDQDQEEKKDDQNKGKNDDQKKDEEQKQDQEQQQQKDQDQQEKGQPQEQKQDRMSKQEAERILDALDQQEKDIQDKVRAKQRVGVRVPIEKDW